MNFRANNLRGAGCRIIRAFAGLPVNLALVALSGHLVNAQNWVQTTAPITNWGPVACSADLTKLVAIASPAAPSPPGPMFISTDGGDTWHQTNSPSTSWYSVAFSADGMKLFAAGDAFWSSTNAGETWSVRENLLGAGSIASSADGMTLIVDGEYDPAPGTPGEFIQVSTNGGITWASNHIDVGFLLQPSVVSSADGTRLAAFAIDFTDYTFWLFASTNSGATWDQLPGPDNSNNYGRLACSADGNTLVAAISLVGVFISHDWGQSWQLSHSFQLQLTNNVSGVAVSANGQKLVMIELTPSSIFRSIDGGASWSDTGAPKRSWGMPSISADGDTIVVAATLNGGIYIWRAVPPAGLNIASSQTGVLLSWNAPSNATLEQNVDLTTGSWSLVTLPPTLTNGQYTLSLSLSNRSTFYRLHSP